MPPIHTEAGIYDSSTTNFTIQSDIAFLFCSPLGKEHTKDHSSGPCCKSNILSCPIFQAITDHACKSGSGKEKGRRLICQGSCL